ncbi:uncharacterized protein CCDC198 [Tachyglossus aculeatus]|uniref:uncharacterized protein CCDC198 n=1 Tax=Tachyglossus aculeatus TaxID=9261 RepID=UPI0018F347E2|nr:uncharacterized protein CCDC198 [Tachyglossus aculeatus]
MGSGSSRTHPKVTRVAPLHSRDAQVEGCNLGTSSGPRGEIDRFERQLPPLRQPWYGRYAAVPGAMSLDTSPENRGTSIIKSHPPRRLQMLEPAGPPQARGRLIQRETAVAPKTKELEKRMQSVKHPLGKRQYLHKMQMLEMNRKRQEAQAELKRNLQRESRIGKQKARERRGKKPFVNLPGNRGWEDLATPEPPGTLSADWGSPWDGELGACQPGGKAERWLTQRADRELPWDASSSDSDGEAEERKKPRALVRTKTERIPLWDEFFDQE